MNAIIIEDEKLSAEHLATLLKKIDPGIRVLNTFDTVQKSIKAFKQGVTADLLFLDVQLADGISFEIFSDIPVDTPIIFTTAYHEYAIKAFKLNSVDYLLKPIGIDELRAAIDKFKKFKHNNYSVALENIVNAYQNINKQFKSRFMIKMGENIVSVKSEDIAHFEFEDGLSLLVTNTGNRYPVDYTLDKLEGLLDPSVFFRINRKVILHINSIRKISAYFNSRLKVVAPNLANENCIVSRERVLEFKQWLDR